MKKINKLFGIICLILLPFLQSCSDDDGFSLGDFTAPNWATVRVTGSAFYLDCDYWGTLLPVNTEMTYEPVDGQRVLTVFNPLYEGFEGYDYAVKLLYLNNALTKGVEVLTSESEEEYGNDPVMIYKGDITVSGGYMNIIFHQNLPKNLENKHRISLVQSEEAEDEDGYVHLELRYNTYGDVSGVRTYGLVSFNLSEVDVDSAKGIKLKLNSEVNEEVEVVFEKKNNAQNIESIANKDFSKMQLR